MKVDSGVSAPGDQLQHLRNIGSGLLAGEEDGFIELLDGDELLENAVVAGSLFGEEALEGSQFLFIFCLLLDDGLDLSVAKLELFLVLQEELLGLSFEGGELVFHQLF